MSNLAKEFVIHLKSTGLFDQYRRKCLENIDDNPSYKNLVNKVEGFTDDFIRTKIWTPDLNRNTLKNEARQYVTEKRRVKDGLDYFVDEVLIKKFLEENEEFVLYEFQQFKKGKDTVNSTTPCLPSNKATSSSYLSHSKETTDSSVNYSRRKSNESERKYQEYEHSRPIFKREHNEEGSSRHFSRKVYCNDGSSTHYYRRRNYADEQPKPYFRRPHEKRKYFTHYSKRPYENGAPLNNASESLHRYTESHSREREFSYHGDEYKRSNYESVRYDVSEQDRKKTSHSKALSVEKDKWIERKRYDSKHQTYKDEEIRYEGFHNKSDQYDMMRNKKSSQESFSDLSSSMKQTRKLSKDIRSQTSPFEVSPIQIGNADGISSLEEIKIERSKTVNATLDTIKRIATEEQDPKPHVEIHVSPKVDPVATKEVLNLSPPSSIKVTDNEENALSCESRNSSNVFSKRSNLYVTKEMEHFCFVEQAAKSLDDKTLALGEKKESLYKLRKSPNACSSRIEIYDAKEKKDFRFVESAAKSLDDEDQAQGEKKESLCELRKSPSVHSDRSDQYDGNSSGKSWHDETQAQGETKESLCELRNSPNVFYDGSDLYDAEEKKDFCSVESTAKSLEDETQAQNEKKELLCELRNSPNACSDGSDLYDAKEKKDFRLVESAAKSLDDEDQTQGEKKESLCELRKSPSVHSDRSDLYDAKEEKDFCFVESATKSLSSKTQAFESFSNENNLNITKEMEDFCFAEPSAKSLSNETQVLESSSDLEESTDHQTAQNDWLSSESSDDSLLIHSLFGDSDTN